MLRSVQRLITAASVKNLSSVQNLIRSVSTNSTLQQRKFQTTPLTTLLGKVAIITGGTSGIGLATAKEFLRCGVERVCLADLNENEGFKALREIGREYGRHRAMFVVTDVRYPNQLQGAFEATMSEFNQLDIVVNNAGIMDEVNWNDQIETNISAVVKGTLLANEFMSISNGGKGGTIINISSIFGLDTLAPLPSFAGTEHFIVGYTRSLGMPHNFKKSGIRVMALCPGVTNTTMITELQNLVDSVSNYQEVQEILKKTPSQSPEVVGRSIIHMFQNGSNGSVWVCEGGLSPYEIEFPNRLNLRKHAHTTSDDQIRSALSTDKDQIHIPSTDENQIHSDHSNTIKPKKEEKETVIRAANQIEAMLKCIK